MKPFSLNIKGRLHTWNRPVVMGILNITPDSFYAGSRTPDTDSLKERVARMLKEGADIIDVGACSTRPGSDPVGIDEEMNRLCRALPVIRRIAPEAIISVDTFRAEIARTAITELDCDIINDISGGERDPEMIQTVASLQVPYVLTHCRNMTEQASSDITPDVMKDLSEKFNELSLAGVNDVIIDPGIGFGKTLEQNYDILRSLPLFHVFHLPVLVGISRKSLICKLLNIDSADALDATSALHAMCLDRGASILRVHDVKAARNCITIHSRLSNQTTAYA